MKKRKTLTVLSIWEKANIRRDWKADNLSAQIHAITGEDAALMVNKAGRILFVTLAAAVVQGLDHDTPDMRIVRGAVNALHDQAGESVIDPVRRASIASGLNAAERLNAVLPPEVIFRAACDLNLKMMRCDGVRLSDFEAILAQAG